MLTAILAVSTMLAIAGRERAGQRMADGSTPPASSSRPQISRRLQALRLRQPGRAEGRHRPPVGHRRPSIRSTSFRRKGIDAAGLGLIYDTLMTSSLDEVSTEYGLLADGAEVSRPTIPRSPIACGRRRSGMTASRSRRRTWSGRSTCSRSYNPQPGLLLPARRQGREDRRARGDLHLRRDGQPRAAAHRRPAAHPAEALVGGHRRQGQASATSPRARSSRRSAPGPTRSSRSSRRGRSSTSACPTTGARTCRSISAPTISTRSATSISATRRSSSRPSRPTSSTGGPRIDGAASGRPATTSRRSKDKRVDARHCTSSPTSRRG